MPSKKNANVNTISEEKKWYQILEGFHENFKLPKDLLVKIFSEETTRIINKNIDPEAEIKFVADDEKQEINIYNTNALVCSDEEELTMQAINITLSEAKKINKKVAENDVMESKIDLHKLASTDLGKSTLNSISQAIRQAIKLAEKQFIYTKFNSKIGEVVKALFNSKNQGGSWNVQIIDEGEPVTGYLPANMISTKRTINPGMYMDVTIEKVYEDTKLSQIEVSLDSPKVVEKSLRNNIPEIAEGLIEIVNIQRQPGERTKVSFKKSENATADFDVQGAIIGQNGQRIEAISSSIGGEKIDVILYSDDIKEYIANAMSPAAVADVVQKVNKNTNEAIANNYWVIVPQYSLTPAIGKKGVNALLASNLTGTKLDVLSIADAKKNDLSFDEAKAAELESKVQKGIKFNRPRNNRNNNNNRRNTKSSQTPIFSMNDFESDVANFEKIEQSQMDSNMFNADDDFNYNDLIAKAQRENAAEEHEDDIDALIDKVQEKPKVVEKKKSAEELSKEDYKKAKDLSKDFKIDEDLSNFGLDSDFDLSSLEDEDWEDK